MDLLDEANCHAGVKQATRKILAKARPRSDCVLTPQERSALRTAKIKKSSIHAFDKPELAALTGMPLARAGALTGLYKFQTMRSIGVAGAEDLLQLGYNCPKDLAGEHPYAMYFAYSCLVGELVDRCVEDVFRCAVAQIDWKNLPIKAKDWWAWTSYRGDIRLPQRSIFLDGLKK